MKAFSFLFITLFVFASLSFAQNFPNRGTLEVGGSLGFSSTTNVVNGQSSSNSTSTFRIEPYIGYFIINSFELGIEPSFTRTGSGDYSSTTFGIYLAPAWVFNLRSNLYPFIEGRIGYNSSSVDDGIPLTPDISSGGFAWGFKGGMKFQVGKSSLVNMAITYDQITMNPKDWTGNRNGKNIFGVNAGVTIFFSK